MSVFLRVVFYAHSNALHLFCRFYLAPKMGDDDDDQENPAGEEEEEEAETVKMEEE